MGEAAEGPTACLCRPGILSGCVNVCEEAVCVGTRECVRGSQCGQTRVCVRSPGTSVSVCFWGSLCFGEVSMCLWMVWTPCEVTLCLGARLCMFSS